MLNKFFGSTTVLDNGERNMILFVFFASFSQAFRKLFANFYKQYYIST